MDSIIVENVRGQWVVDRDSEKEFTEKVGYQDGALIQLQVKGAKSLCHHPQNPVVCEHCK